MSTSPDPDEPVREGPHHPDEAAELRERADGAHEEQISDEANLREDDSPPGTDPAETEG